MKKNKQSATTEQANYIFLKNFTLERLKEVKDEWIFGAVDELFTGNEAEKIEALTIFIDKIKADIPLTDEEQIELQEIYDTPVTFYDCP